MTLLAGRAVNCPRRHPRPGQEKAPRPDPFERGSASERRRSPRRQGNPVPVEVSDTGVRVEPAQGWAFDRSMGGLGLILSEPAEVGTALSVRPRQGPIGTYWVRVEVRNCRRARDCFEVGCRFVHTPPWGVRLLFG
jgi:hypothetical protein